MKRFLFSLIVVLMISALVVPAVLAGPAYSAIQVLNLGPAEATIWISYYDQEGVLVTLPGGLTNPVEDTVAVGESNTYFPVHTADGYNGSVVIESTEPIAVISNITYVGPLMQSSWNGFEDGGAILRFPLIMKGNNGQDTTFNVQNTTSAAVDIIIEFIPEPGAGYADIDPVADTIEPFAAHTYNQATMPEFDGITKWVGSARVAVDGEGAVAGVAQVLDMLRNTASAYNGFLAGSAVVDAPLIMTANNGLWTAINCQNLGPATDVTVNFIPEAGYAAKPPETKTDVAENGTAVFLQYGTTKWVGGAQITNADDNDMACVINQINLGTFYASSYEGFDGALATDVATAPMVQFQPQADGNLWTSINVKNLSEDDATITVDFKPGPGFADVPDQTKTADPGAVAVFLFYDPYGNGTKFLGGAEIGSDVGAVAVVVNQQKISYVGDYFSSYDGFAR